MKHFATLLPLALSGISAAAALTGAESPTTPLALRDALPFSPVDDAPLDGTLYRRGVGPDHAPGDWHQWEKRQSQTTAVESLTPEHLATLLSQLRVVYGYLAAFSRTQNTGLLNGLLRLVGGVVPPLSDVIESVRALLIGDSVSVYDRLAIAQAIGIHAVTTTYTETVTVERPAAAATPLNVDIQLSACLLRLTACLAVAPAATPVGGARGPVLGIGVPVVTPSVSPPGISISTGLGVPRLTRPLVPVPPASTTMGPGAQPSLGISVPDPRPSASEPGSPGGPSASADEPKSSAGLRGPSWPTDPEAPTLGAGVTVGASASLGLPSLSPPLTSIPSGASATDSPSVPESVTGASISLPGGLPIPSEALSSSDMPLLCSWAPVSLELPSPSGLPVVPAPDTSPEASIGSASDQLSISIPTASTPGSPSTSGSIGSEDDPAVVHGSGAGQSRPAPDPLASVSPVIIRPSKSPFVSVPVGSVPSASTPLASVFAPVAPSVSLPAPSSSLSAPSLSLPTSPDSLPIPPVSISTPEPSPTAQSMPVSSVSRPGDVLPSVSAPGASSVQAVSTLPSVPLPSGSTPSTGLDVTPSETSPTGTASVGGSISGGSTSQVPGAGSQPDDSNLRAQVSSLLSSGTRGEPALPTLPSISSQEPATRSSVDGPSFLTSVLSTTATVADSTTTAVPSQSLHTSSLPLAEPSAARVGVPDPDASVFDPRSPGNVAVYFGLPGTDPETSLLDICADPNVHIVILGFLSDVTYGGGTYPRLQLNPCLPNTQTSQMKRIAPGLAFYRALEQDIRECQTRHGKKIFLSIGGPENDLPLDSDEDAINFANRLWELFGPPGQIDPSLRPFGSAVLDGFDLSKQDECAANFDTFAATLRSHFAAEMAKDYFLSAAPGCAYPDISIHPGYLAQSDFVWPRFYNDSKCEVGADGFADAVRAWSNALRPNSIPMRDSSAFKTRLYIGLPAREGFFARLAGGIQGLAAVAAQAVALAPDNFGGFAVEDGETALGLLVEEQGLLGWIGRALGALL